MKKLRFVFITVILTIMLSGCSYLGVAPQAQSQEAKAIQSNIVVSVKNGKASNIKDLDRFLESVNNGRQANLQIKRFIHEGDDPILTTIQNNNGVIRYSSEDSSIKPGATSKGIKADYSTVIKEENEDSIFLILIDKNGAKTKVFLSTK